MTAAPGAVARSVVAWSKDDPFGAELAELSVGPASFVAHGVAVGSAPVAYRLDYELEAGAGFVTSSLRVTARGDGWSRGLDLGRGPDGTWVTAAVEEGWAPFDGRAGGDVEAVVDALDVDLALSPLTNTMPVLRHGVLDGGAAPDLVVAWVSVPDLAVHRSRQRYTFVGRRPDGTVTVRFEALDGDFAADVVLDGQGVVVDYPGVATRIRAAHG